LPGRWNARETCRICLQLTWVGQVSGEGVVSWADGVDVDPDVIGVLVNRDLPCGGEVLV